MNKLKYLFLSLLFLLVFPINVFAGTISNSGSYDGLNVSNANGTGSSNVNIRIYRDENGNAVTCLSPHQCFGTAGNGSGVAQYEDKDISDVLNKCASSYSFKDGSPMTDDDKKICGEAVILQTVNENDYGLGMNTDNQYIAQTIALRMWEATAGDWNPNVNGAVDNNLYQRLGLLIQSSPGHTIDANDPRVQEIVKGNSDIDIKILQAAINYYSAAAVGGGIKNNKVEYNQDKGEVYTGASGETNLQLDANVQNGSIISITGGDGTVLTGSVGDCKDGTSGCLTVDISSLKEQVCKGKEDTTTIKIKYKSDDAVSSLKRLRPTSGDTAGCQQMIVYDTENNVVEDEIPIPCDDIIKKPCTEDEETGICYGPNGEELEDCSQLEEVCGPCIIEDGKCYRNEEEVSCDECDICVKVGDNCFVAGNQVDCEDYPECEDTCEKRGDKCYVGEKEVPCEDYPDCLGICEREPGGGCTLGGEPVDCEDYEECKDFVCEKIGDVCFMGGKQVPCVYPPECQYDDPDTPDNCPIRKIDELPYYSCKDGDTEGELADPPMCSILKNNIRGAYKIDEYSNEWCDVYCRETYSFKFMDKETAQSGRYFRHNVESKYVSISNLSTVVTATQQCTSLINYDDWKKAYMSANAKVRTSWNELKKWEARWEVSDGQSGLPTEVIECGGGCSGCCHGDAHPDACNDWAYLWYDNVYGNTNNFGIISTPSANLTETGKSAVCASQRCKSRDKDGNCLEWVCDGEHSQAKTAQQAGYSKQDVINGHMAAIGAYTSALNYRQSLIQKLFDCNFFDDSEVYNYFTSNDPRTYTVSYWQQNSHSTSQVRSNTYHQILQRYAPNSELENLVYDDQGRLKEEGSASNVWFDKEISPAIGTEGIEDKKGYKTSAESNDPNDSTVCGGCDDPIHDSLSDVPNDDDEYGVIDGREFTFWVCYEHTSGGYCQDESSIISLMPKNYVANLEVTREIGYWQNTRFSTEIFTGKVVEGSGGLQLPEKSWPLAISTLTGDYNIFIKFSEFGDAKRKKGTLKLEFSDDVNCAYTVVNEMTKYDCDDGYHECYDCDDPSTPENECYPNGEDPNKNKLDLGFYFRSIDLDDVFPNSKYSPNQTLLNPNRPIGSNWNTQNAIQVINKIQDLGEGYLGGGKEPEYSITLTPAMRKKVTKNNREIYKADYLTPSTLSCNHSTAICQSTWLRNDLRNILEDYNHGDYFVENDNSKNNLYVVGRNR